MNNLFLQNQVLYMTKMNLSSRWIQSIELKSHVGKKKVMLILLLKDESFIKIKEK